MDASLDKAETTTFPYCLSGMLLGRNPLFSTQDKSWIPERAREDKTEAEMDASLDKVETTTFPYLSFRHSFRPESTV